MKARYAYPLLFLLPSALLATLAALVFAGGATGVLWIFVYGDDPWPAQAGNTVMVLAALACALMFAALVGLSYKRREPAGGVRHSHVLAALGLTVALPLLVGQHQWRIGNLGSSEDSQPHLTFDALGSVQIGQSVQALVADVGPLSPGASSEGEERCYYISAAGAPSSVMLMIDEGHVGRIDVVEAGVRTLEGASVGLPAVELKRIYGTRLQAEPHKYAYPEGQYLTLQSSNGRHANRFETDGDVVTSFYAGTADTITLSEGCQ